MGRRTDAAGLRFAGAASPGLHEESACPRLYTERVSPLRLIVVPAVALAALTAVSGAQTRRAAPSTLRTGPADVTCPAPLGTGVRTGRLFCDVLSGREPADGILVKLPRHIGPAVLLFDLHNRHTYSAEQVRAGRAFTRYTATIGVLTMDNNLLSRAVVRNEFRREHDLFDRIAGGGGTAGVKAVAPTGVESIVITIPAGIEQVSILGEKLSVSRLDGDATYTSPGRPIALISQPMIEYRPAPAPRTRRRR